MQTVLISFFYPPRGGCGYVDFLLDDLKGSGIDKLYADGLKPFYILETSPKNFQVILRFAPDVADKEEYLTINRFLVKKYNGDTGSIGTAHFFRLAGFTNRKEKYCCNGLYPFVKLSFEGNILNNDLLPKVEPLRSPKAVFRTFPVCGKGCSAYIAAIYQSGGFSDISSLDFKAAMYASRKGFSIEAIKDAMLKLSPDIENRKKGHVADYLLRTMKKCFCPSVKNFQICDLRAI